MNGRLLDEVREWMGRQAASLRGQGLEVRGPQACDETEEAPALRLEVECSGAQGRLTVRCSGECCLQAVSVSTRRDLLCAHLAIGEVDELSPAFRALVELVRREGRQPGSA